MRDAILISVVFIGIYFLGFFTGMKYYEHKYPIPPQPKIYKTYEVIDKIELNEGWYQYTLIDVSAPIFDSITVALPDELNIGYDKVNLTK